MANAYTSTELLASIKRRGLIPTTTATLSTSEFYKIVDDEVQTFIVPLLLEVREEYLVVTDELTAISGTSPAEYYIPERAIGGKLRDLSIDDVPLTRIEPDNVDEAGDTLTATAAFYLRGNRIVLVGTTSGTLSATYYQRPGRVVATSAVGEITAINTATRVVTVSGSCPSTFTTSVSYDFVKGKSGFDTLGKDFTASAVGASTVTFSSALPTDLAVGDFVCIAQESPIAQAPVELHPLLAQRVTATVLHSLSDPKAKAAYDLAADMEARVRKLLAPRTEGANRYIVNKYGVGRGRRITGRNTGW